MNGQRKDEIIRKVFYRHIENIMRDLERCEDIHIVFQLGMDMGMMHRDLEDELSAEVESEEQA